MAREQQYVNCTDSVQEKLSATSACTAEGADNDKVEVEASLIGDGIDGSGRGSSSGRR